MNCTNNNKHNDALYLIPLFIGFIIGVFLIMCIERYYKRCKKNIIEKDNISDDNNSDDLYPDTNIIQNPLYEDNINIENIIIKT